ncbi:MULTISPECIES: hypothetical protein [Vibrio]|uniref:Uncharacterized protein n=1 Tax=Vibrio splendidus TaxID=29497 RepID=A0A2N7JXG4_VIBSP|nr:hypothetical protein [Vibrio splendidus]PMM64852.1 hypothetical protein BCT54_17310 [Vibrio splendidus]
MKKNISHKKQGGFTLPDLALWVVLASALVLGVIQIYASVSGMLKEYQVTQAVSSLKGAAENVKIINHTGLTIAKVCDEKRNAAPKSICGQSRDGKSTNPYGGDYQLAPNSNLSLVDVTVTGIDTQYIDSLADKLANMSAGNCAGFTGCSSIKLSGNDITVTL